MEYSWGYDSLFQKSNHLTFVLCSKFFDVVYDVQVLLTETHLAIVMEYANGGELFDRICIAGRFSEDEVPITHFISRFQDFLKTNTHNHVLVKTSLMAKINSRI